MEPKKRKRKTKYTLMVFSDSMEEGVKQIYFGPGKQMLIKIFFAAVFIAFVADICYIVYNPIILSGVRERNGTQAKRIEELEAEKKSLEAEKTSLETEIKELTEKVAILSETINQKVQADEAAEAQRAELSIPKGFPLTGSATIQDGGETPGDEEGQEAAQENKEEEPVLVFKGTKGNMVIAAGIGTVASVEPDAQYGNKVIIDHGNGYKSIYRNRGDARVKTGDEVVRGSALFIIDGENLELGYQIMQGESYINPEEIIEING